MHGLQEGMLKIITQQKSENKLYKEKDKKTMATNYLKRKLNETM